MTFHVKISQNIMNCCRHYSTHLHRQSMQKVLRNAEEKTQSQTYQQKRAGKQPPLLGRTSAPSITDHPEVHMNLAPELSQSIPGPSYILGALETSRGATTSSPTGRPGGADICNRIGQRESSVPGRRYNWL